MVEVLGEGNLRHLYAYVVLEPTMTSGEARAALRLELDRHLRNCLPAYMVPHGYVFVDALPLSANGKIDRRRLPAPDEQTSVTRRYEAPANALEQSIGAVWSEMLGIERIGRHDNFFEIGGNSVLIVQMHGQLAPMISTAFSIADLFAHVTIAEMAAYLSGHDASATVLAESAERAQRQRASLGRRRNSVGAET